MMRHRKQPVPKDLAQLYREECIPLGADKKEALLRLIERCQTRGWIPCQEIPMIEGGKVYLSESTIVLGLDRNDEEPAIWLLYV